MAAWYGAGWLVLSLTDHQSGRADDPAMLAEFRTEARTLWIDFPFRWQPAARAIHTSDLMPGNGMSLMAAASSKHPWAEIRI